VSYTTPAQEALREAEEAERKAEYAYEIAKVDRRMAELRVQKEAAGY
jgi:hypothetical protein